VPVQLVAGGESMSCDRFSPDGAWLLYVAGDRQSTRRLMRVAMSGGPSELVIGGQGMENYYCTAAVANLCVIWDGVCILVQLTHVAEIRRPFQPRSARMDR
jgi:hypothetical protein